MGAYFSSTKETKNSTVGTAGSMIRSGNQNAGGTDRSSSSVAGSGGALTGLPARASTELLPPEMWLAIASHLSLEDRSRLGGVDSGLNKLAWTQQDVRVRACISALRTADASSVHDALDALALEFRGLTPGQRAAVSGPAVVALNALCVNERTVKPLPAQESFCEMVTGLAQALPFIGACEAVARRLSTLLHSDMYSLEKSGVPKDLYNALLYKSTYRTLVEEAAKVSAGCATAVEQGVMHESALGWQIIEEKMQRYRR